MKWRGTIKVNGYLRYKTITSQNVPSEAQVKDFFVSLISFVLSSKTIPRFSKSVTSWWVLVHETVHFWIYLLNHNSLTHLTWSIDRCKQGQYFPEIFWTTWRTAAKFQVLFHLATSSNYSITNYVKFLVFHFFRKGE